MHNACELAGGSEVDDHVHVVVRLQERGGNLVGDGTLNGLLDNLRLAFTPCREVDAACGQDGSHAHRHRAGRHHFAAVHAASHFLARRGVDKDDARLRVERRSRLVGGNVAHAADAQQHHVDAAEGLDALLVESAVLLHALLCHRAVEREDVLAVDVDMVEEALVEQLQGCELRLWRDGIVFVSVEHDDILEAHALLLVIADELVVDGCERGAGAESEHAVLAFALFLFDFLHHGIGNGFGSLLHLRIDVGGQFLHSRDFAAVNGRQRTIECFWYFVKYDL